jgi:hypothetical protein
MCSGCVLLNRGPNMVQEQGLYGCWFWSVSGTRTVAV